MTARERALEKLVRRAAEELSYFNAHGDECEARFNHECEVCQETDEADEHCTCFLALHRDLEAALTPTPKPPTPKRKRGAKR